MHAMLVARLMAPYGVERRQSVKIAVGVEGEDAAEVEIDVDDESDLEE